MPLDTYQRAYSLLSHITYEIEHYLFNPSRYLKAEQREFYAEVKLKEYLGSKINLLAPSYRADFERYINRAKEFFTTKDVREIRKIDIINYQSYLSEKLNVGNKTIKNMMDVFKAFMNYLKNDLEVISAVPKFPDIDIDMKPFKWLFPEDQMRLFELVPDGHKPIFAFLMLQGCRPSEARALRCKDVDLKNRTITIVATFSGNVYRERRKGKKSRFFTIPIHDELMSYMVERVKNNLPEAYLFVNPNTGGYYGENTLRIIWSKVREKAGVDKGLRLYDATRHSVASNLVNQGVSLSKISKILGHSTVKMSEKYAHVHVESLRVDLGKLSLNRQQTVNNNVLPIKKVK